LRNQAQIGALVVNHPFLFVRRDAAGLNLHQLTPSGNGSEPSGQQEPSTTPVVIQKLEANGGTIEFTDATLSPPLKTVVEGVAAVGNRIVLSPGFKTGDVSAEGQLGSGSIELQGNLDTEPLRGKFSLVGENLPFVPFDGYLDQLFTNAKFSGDSLAGDLQIALFTDEQGGRATSLTGKVEGRNIGLHFPEVENSFLTGNRVGVVLRTIRLGSDPRVDIERIVLEGARLEVVRNEAGELNLTRLWASEPKKSSTETEAGDQTNTVAIRSVTVEEGSIEILDRSVSPNYTTLVSQLKGSLADLSPRTERSELEMEGRLGEEAHLMLTGWFTPFAEKPYVQLHGTIKSYALPPLNPYATEYLSHRIRQGEVTTEIDYTLKGNELQANAGLVLRNLRLGEKTGDQFAQRIGIPLELAIALLQDASGVIRLQVAMTSETGPKLNVASLIWRAVRNALTRAITAPFRLVGNILTLGGRIGGISIDPVVFEPGTRELQPESQKQLDRLATLLNEKPRLELTLNGNVSRSELDALKTTRFWQRIQSAKGRNYEEALINVYQQLGGVTDPAVPLTPVAEESLEKFVMERLDLDREAQKKLALERARLVEDELRARGVDPERLTVNVAESFATENPSVEIEVASS
jgi:outer membrane protein OmpA-like peptidoglycan-associated protein